ncbi:PP2C family protein-serine/threonine phosphatase [Sediminitomix flava]|uniref:Serine phosphatase RsbU (Regulator of sigma subunit) n=1 Tax=Sediminitomix flava TaxID=379075 RepID=A0A315Z951_SEDFL|nr:SpoIIE family protein phosphatase [Sediminitomix flava]PWJ40744.1 serine phosphatase RsbU (regulator of sigma subunit) [Sediminitomix flava]
MNRLLRIGVDEIGDIYLKEKVYTSNIIAVISITLSVLYGIIGHFFFPAVVPIAVIGTLALLCVLALNHLRWFTLSRLICGLATPYLMYLFQAVLTSKEDALIGPMVAFGITFSFFPFFLFDFREKTKLIFISFLVLIPIVFQEDLIKAIEVEGIDNSLYRNPYFVRFSYLLSGLTLLSSICIFLYRKSIVDLKNTNLIRKTQEQHQEILSQNEELHQQTEELVAQQELVEERSTKLEHANKKLEEAMDQLKVKNQLISESIHAAQTIQEAILPNSTTCSNILGEYFIFNQPKDIVSGDFYWNYKIDNQIFLVVADCTGHGVPAAFMTLIGHTILDRIIKYQGIHEPNLILHHLHDEILRLLNQKDGSNKDGMDLSIVRYHKTEKGASIIFAGAKTTIFYTKSGKIQTLKGDRKAIGGFELQKEFQFTNHELELHSDEMFYLMSDGYADQHNHDRKKFGTAKLIEFLNEINSLEVSQQKGLLTSEMNTFQGSQEQRDDMLIIGVKV